MDEKWLTVQEVAERFGVSIETVRRWIRNGDLPVLDLGGPRMGYRIAEADLAKFVSDRYGRLGKIAA